jgi:hypothetical protein
VAYAVAASVERRVVERRRRVSVMSWAREAGGAVGRERRAGTVMRGWDRRVPCVC